MKQGVSFPRNETPNFQQYLKTGQERFCSAHDFAIPVNREVTAKQETTKSRNPLFLQKLKLLSFLRKQESTTTKSRNPLFLQKQNYCHSCESRNPHNQKQESVISAALLSFLRKQESIFPYGNKGGNDGRLKKSTRTSYAINLITLLFLIFIGSTAAHAALDVSFTQESTSLAIGEEGTWEVTIANTGF